MAFAMGHSPSLLPFKNVVTCLSLVLLQASLQSLHGPDVVSPHLM